jgi:hypothetical protein
MADDIDRAQTETDFFLARAINNLQRRELTPRGECLFCAEKVTDRALFCGSECRDDYDRLVAARARVGLG